jgi:hypothetical protein
MITWISKSALALGIATMLGACDGTGAQGGFLAGLAPPQEAALPPVPLTQARMMQGSIALVPPSGFCIDPESLSQSFAIMARCDILGAPTGGTGAPAGVLTVSFVRGDAQAVLPTAQVLAGMIGVTEPTNIRRASMSVIFQTTGDAPSDDLSPTHWRSVTLLGPYMMGAALFGPEGRRAVSGEGAGVLSDMIRRTIEKTNTR